MILSFIRTAILYLILIVLVRIMGKRQIGQMEPAEFVVTMLAANLAAIPMQDSAIPLFSGLVPIITILAIELLLSAAALHSLRLRKLLCGNPVVLIRNGRILVKNLALTRVTMDELSGLLREKDVLDIRTVQYAILETNGNLSVFPYSEHQPASAKDAGIPVPCQHMPIPLISDGRLLEENLVLAGKDRAWVDRVLKENLCTLEQTWLLTADRAGNLCFYRKEE